MANMPTTPTNYTIIPPSEVRAMLANLRAAKQQPSGGIVGAIANTPLPIATGDACSARSQPGNSDALMKAFFNQAANGSITQVGVVALPVKKKRRGKAKKAKKSSASSSSDSDSD